MTSLFLVMMVQVSIPKGWQVHMSAWVFVALAKGYSEFLKAFGAGFKALARLNKKKAIV